MPDEKLREICEQLKVKGEIRFLEPATKEQIESFEKEKHILFPSKYKEWLQFSDGGELFLPAGLQLYGVFHKPIIDIDEKDRPNEDYIVIGVLSTGDPIVFEKGKEQISIYNHEAGRIEKDEIYQDFLAFLKDLPNMLGIGE